MEREEAAESPPGAGVGACSFNPSVVAAGADAVGIVAVLGGRAGALVGLMDNAHLVAEEADTLQAAGRERALVTLSTTPSWALLLKASQMHSASAFKTVLSPEQQVPSGFSVVLPLETKDKQSAMFSTRVEQSTPGGGAPDDTPRAEPATQAASAKRRRQIFVASIFPLQLVLPSLLRGGSRECSESAERKETKGPRRDE